MRVGHIGPLQSPSQNHTKHPEQSMGVFLFLCTPCLSLSETSSLSVLVTRSVCVAASAEADSVLVNGREVIC